MYTPDVPADGALFIPRGRVRPPHPRGISPGWS